MDTRISPIVVISSNNPPGIRRQKNSGTADPAGDDLRQECGGGFPAFNTTNNLVTSTQPTNEGSTIFSSFASPITAAEGLIDLWLHGKAPHTVVLQKDFENRVLR